MSQTVGAVLGVNRFESRGFFAHFLSFLKVYIFTLESRLTAPQARVGDFTYEARGATGGADQGALQLDVAVDEPDSVHTTQAWFCVRLEAGHKQHNANNTKQVKCGRHSLVRAQQSKHWKACTDEHHVYKNLKLLPIKISDAAHLRLLFRRKKVDLFTTPVWRAFFASF